MKKYLFVFALLLGVTALTACSSGNDFQEEVLGNKQEEAPVSKSQTDKPAPEDPDDTIDTTSVILPDAQSIDAATLYASVVGKGWMQTECHLINRDGTTYLQRDFNYRMVGGINNHLAFSSDVLTTFFATTTQGLIYFYRDRGWQYDEQTNIVTASNGQQIKVLSVSETELQVIFIDCGKMDDWETNELIDISLYVVYRVMTDSELEETREKYWVNYDDMNRQMTPKDLHHKWVLTNYTDDQSIMHYVGNDRRDDKNYIRFADDGTFEGKAQGKEFSGTYKYNGMRIDLTPSTSIDNVGNNYFLKKVWKVKSAVITAGAYLSMNIGSENSFYFVRGIE